MDNAIDDAIGNAIDSAIDSAIDGAIGAIDRRALLIMEPLIRDLNP